MNHLHTIDPHEHFALFKTLYADSLNWTSTSSFASVVDYEAALFSPTSIWRVYIKDAVPLGIAGFHNINMVDGTGDPLVGIVEHARRQGYGLAMGWELAKLGFEELGLRRLHTIVLKDAPSRQLLIKMGFVHEATLTDARFRHGKYEDVFAYRMFKKEYEKCRQQ